jgi:anaerobic selenocysteine-containing dehydrogenase
VYWHLAQRLGIPEAALEEVIPAPGDANVERFLRGRLARFPEVTLERLAEGPVLAPGAVEVAFADLRFPTPSGRIELWSDEAARRWGVDPLPDWREPDESPPRAGGGDHPLHFLTPNTKNRIHSQFGNLAMIRQLDGGRAFAMMHPADAHARGLRAGDTVEVFNDRGALTLELRYDHGLRPGCVAVTNGWWIEQGGTVNFLSMGRETDMGHGAAFHDNRVEVRAAGSGAA